MYQHAIFKLLLVLLGLPVAISMTEAIAEEKVKLGMLGKGDEIVISGTVSSKNNPLSMQIQENDPAPWVRLSCLEKGKKIDPASLNQEGVKGSAQDWGANLAESDSVFVRIDAPAGEVRSYRFNCIPRM
ncbi:MAG: hypothetical protein G8345_14100 [Magnetococcales bacterium]|nr:hypothetical protein [Magnetococcales bacterium]NGZ28009.1 hypothetical protein [Magnetococcales bacterium]